MKELNYNTIEDFLEDETFISFVYLLNEENNDSWNSFLRDHPEKKPLADKAAEVLNLIRIQERPVSENQLSAAESRIKISINQIKKQGKIIRIERNWYKVAAAVIIISFVIGLGFLMNRPEKKAQLATNYGEVKKDRLPDGSEVILNANSNVTLGKKWKDGEAREVWVKGEVFFHVKKTVHHDKFIVHTNAFDIEVTGTSFNVINEKDKSSVVLKEGSVKLHRVDESEIIMKPGDYVEFTNNQIEKKKIVKDDYLAWTQNKLVFDNTKLTDVARMIKEHYGVDVKLEGNSIGEKTITGIMPNDSLVVLIKALEATQEFRIDRSDNTIIISNKNH